MRKGLMSTMHAGWAVPLMLFLAVASHSAPSVRRAVSTPASANSAASVPNGAADSAMERAHAALMSDPNVALVEATRARAIAEQLPQSNSRVLALAKADWLAGASLIGLNRSAEAAKLLQRALDGGVARLAPHSKLLGDLNRARATAAMILGDIEPALMGLQRAYRIYGDAGERRSQALALVDIGSIYVLARDYPHALNYYTQSAETFRDDPALLVSIYYNRGNVLREQGQQAAAANEFQKALALAQQMKSHLLEARILASLGAAQVEAGNLDAADRSIARSFRLTGDAPTADWKPLLYGVAAQAALRRGRLRQAATLIETSLDSSASGNSASLLRDSHHIAYEIYKASGENERALVHLEAFKQLDDQARALAASTNAALMSAQFEFANQNLQIAELRRGESVRDATIARNRATLLTGLLAGAGTISALLLIGFIWIRRSRNQVRAANTELSSSNVQLEKALAARTEFLATTSHEIRTPLNGILGMTQVLLADRALGAEVRDRIELVHGAGETMRALVDDLLDLSKISNGELRIHKAEMSSAAMLRDACRVWEDQARAKRITLSCDLSACPENIIEDEIRFRQIVFNLMANAIKFTDRGTVRLSARPATDGSGGERLCIRIEDTGIGIPPDRLDEVFESFRQVDGGTTRRHGGTGLGLAICRNLARAMGGDVTVESVLGAGSAFILDLPLERATAVEIETQPKPTALAQAGMLLVEGNPLSQSVMRALLTPHVRSLAIAPGSAEALAHIAEEPIDAVIADAATLDLDMDRAAVLAAEMRARGGTFALLWPRPDETVCARAAAAGIDCLIAKPIVAPELVATLKALYKPQQADAEIAA